MLNIKYVQHSLFNVALSNVTKSFKNKQIEYICIIHCIINIYS